MVDFRKALLLLAVMVVATGIASAQVFNPLSCTANAGVPPLLRAEGIAEEVGQVTINCIGGVPTAASAAIPTVNVQIFLSTNLTSRLLNSSAGYSEAMLLVDEPGSPGNPTRLLCPAGTICPKTSANGNGDKVSYDGSAPGRENMYQAVRVSDVSVAWLGVPVDAPGTANNRTLRIANVRANASTVPFSELVPTAVTMTISITGTGSLSLTNPVLTVGFVQRGLTASVSAVNLKQCEQFTNPFTVSVKEGFANAFRLQPAGIGSSVFQDVPGFIYNTESMFVSLEGPSGAGVATQATRVMVAFRNIPANVGLSVPNQIVVSVPSGNETLQLVTGTNSNGGGGTVTSGTGSTTILAIDSSSRNGMAVYELTTSNVSNITSFPIPVTPLRNSTSPLPALGSGEISVSFAPLSTVQTMSETEPAPRFVDRGDQQTALSVTACKTNLLWPYVTSFTGFDTGLAISNTSQDPFGTPTQTGACLVSYYGTAPSGVTLPSRISIGEIMPGRTAAWTLTGGNGGDVAGITNFTGYVIAECNFQFAHGYGFISNLGDTRWAQGYLALVLDADMFDPNTTSSTWLTRTGDRSETLKH